MKRIFCLFILALLCVFFVLNYNLAYAKAQMPFYNLEPQKIVLRSSFFTSFNENLVERKHNIETCVKKLNNTLVDVGGEFSFNKRIGERNGKNGYKNAKIIIGGRFVEGIGGGVCQVSTTLYNAVLLSGLKVTEYHAHSLAVSYVALSFDAMVSYPYADLKFVNNTKNPLIIKAFVSGNRVVVELYGEKSEYKFVRESNVIEEILCNDYDELEGETNGEIKIISYPKNGYKSNAKIKKLKDGKVIDEKIIRTDYYKPTKGIITKI